MERRRDDGEGRRIAEEEEILGENASTTMFGDDKAAAAADIVSVIALIVLRWYSLGRCFTPRSFSYPPFARNELEPPMSIEWIAPIVSIQIALPRD